MNYHPLNKAWGTADLIPTNIHQIFNEYYIMFESKKKEHDLMPQIGFYIGGGSIGFKLGPANLGGGLYSFLLAWDRYNRGPSAMDSIDWGGCALYAWTGPVIQSFSLCKLRSKKPIQIPEENCPIYPDDDLNWVYRFDLKGGSISGSNVAEFSFDIFDLDGSTPIYGVAPEGKTLKFETPDYSVIPSAVSFEDRLLMQALEDPPQIPSGISGTLESKEIWRSLMTPNQPVGWF
jgi:hypothetical protein